MNEQTIKRERRKSAPNGGTLTSAIVDRLRRDIVTGQLPPEQWLRIEVLKLRYDSGASPIREALNRLCSEGLVVQHDQRGFQVAPVSIEDISDITRTRGLIYEIGLRESIALGDLAWEEGVLVAFHRLSKANQIGDGPEDSIDHDWQILHKEFHRSLISACQSRWLIEFSDLLWDLTERYRFLAYHHRPEFRENIRAEHQALVDATLARDAETAIGLIKGHIQHTATLAGHL
jgi:GntR family transcriptional regulator, carbon starvation induced regulator